MKKTIILSIMTTLITGVSIAQTSTTDEQSIRGIVATMQKGWNEKNGTLFASGFAEKHDYIVISGIYLSGITPEINANAHQGIFNSVYKTTDLELRIDKIKMLRADLALVHLLAGTYEHGANLPEHPKAIISMVVEKKNGVWKIISFHNCDIEISFDPKEESRSLVPPKVMYSAWYRK